MLGVIKQAISDRKEKARFLNEWNRSVDGYVDFLKTRKAGEVLGEKKECRIGILLTPWMGLPVPWYAMTIGLILADKGYQNIVWIVNDIWERKSLVCPYYMEQVQSVKKVLGAGRLRECQFEVMALSDLADAVLDEDDRNMMARCSALNTIKYWGNSIKDDGHAKIQGMWMALYGRMCGKIKKCSTLAWDRIVIPGGAFQEAGLFLELFRKRGIGVITYDSGIRSLALAINGCAAQNEDIGCIVQSIIENRYEINTDMAIKDAKDIFVNRMQANPEIGVVGKGDVIQNITYEKSAGKGYDIVLFTNLEFDTAALGTHDAFPDDYTWIMETVKFVLENTKATIAIRQHPMQKDFAGIKTNEESLRKEFEGNDRVAFINYDEKISSYKLLEEAKVIIVNTSTIGLEAGMVGKPVITDSHAYYCRASFVRYGGTVQDYFASILDVLDKKAEVSMQSRKEAAIYYFFTQRCSWAMTDFTPQPEDYWRWVKKPYGELLEDNIAGYMTKNIVELEPLAKQICEEELSGQSR